MTNLKEPRKVLQIELAEPTYQKLRSSAMKSSRDLSAEFVLRLENGLSILKNKTDPVVIENEAGEKRLVMLTMPQTLHTDLKVTSASAQLFMKEYAEVAIKESLKEFGSLANEKEGIKNI